MLEKTISAVIWDMDGVLIDSEPGYTISIGEMVQSFGYPYGEREIAKVTGSSFKNFVEILGLDVPKEKIQKLYIEALMKSVSVDVSELVVGVASFLDLLKSCRIKMAIGSSSPRELVDYIIKRFELNRWFDIIVTGNDAENGKPAPDIFLKCANLLNVSPTECLVIEDSANGILAGKNAGMYVCAFTGTRRHDVDVSKADFEINSFSPNETNKIVNILKQMD